MKKNIILIIVIILLIGGAVIYFQWPKKEAMVKPVLLKVPEKKVLNSGVGYGWSIKNNPKEAVEEAAGMVRKSLANKSPHFLFLFSTVGYDPKIVLELTRKSFGKKTQIYGGTSCLATLTKDGFHQGKVGSLAMLGVASPMFQFGVGGASLNNFSSAKEAAKKALRAAIKNAGKSLKEKPKMVLQTAAPGKEEEIIAGIEEIIGRDIPIIGGSSGDNDLTGKWRQFANDKVYANGLALAVVYTDNKIGFDYEAGYKTTEKRGTITKAKGRTIYEINHQPAAVVYNQWTGGLIKNKLAKGGTILQETPYYPLAKIIRVGKKGLRIVSIHPLSVNLPEKSLTVFANVETGDEIMLLHGGWETLLNRAQKTTRTAKQFYGIKKDDILFGVYTFCAGTLLAIPKSERGKMPFLVNNELGGHPFIGTFTFGEQGYLRGAGNFHGNLANSMVIFTKSK